MIKETNHLNIFSYVVITVLNNNYNIILCLYIWVLYKKFDFILYTSNTWAAGIKLGTTFSSIGKIEEHGCIDLVYDKYANCSWIPSFVSYADFPYKVGEMTLDDKRRSLHDVIYVVKRMLGHKYNDTIIQQLKSKNAFLWLNNQAMEILKSKHVRPNKLRKH